MVGVSQPDRESTVKSKAASVADYIEEQPDEWRPTLKKLRATCRRELSGYAEAMRYGMPAYERGGRVEVSFAKQARYLSLYILKQPIFEAHRAELAGLSIGKGCIRFSSPAQIDWAMVSRLLSDTRDSSDEIC
jgi:uncharacterized protein YdhG (YjbR/CyaY superfamily)